MQEAPDCLFDWADNWGMAFNLGHACGKKESQVPVQVLVLHEGNQNSTAEEERDVGVTISPYQVTRVVDPE